MTHYTSLMYNVVLLDLYKSEIKGEKEVLILDQYQNYFPYRSKCSYGLNIGPNLYVNCHIVEFEPLRECEKDRRQRASEKKKGHSTTAFSSS